MTPNIATSRPNRLRVPLALAAACGLAAPAAAQLSEPFPAVFELESLLPAHGGNGSLGFVVETVEPWDIFGAAVASAGDINGDGVDDLLVAAPGYSYCHWYYGCYARADGGAYIIYGRDAAAPGFPASISTADADVHLRAKPGGTHEDGSAVAPLGDVSGDGLDDIVVGGGGRSYVIYGSDGPLPHTIDLPDLDGEIGSKLLASGWAAAPAGDVNGDGLRDIILGDPTATTRSRNGCGRTFVFFGRDGGFPASTHWSEIDGVNGFRLFGAAAGDHSGYSVASAGDINGDGVDDIITGAPRSGAAAPAVAGSSYVVYGQPSGLFPESTDLGELDVADGFRLDGAQSPDHTGWSVSPLDDFNGDGIDDIIVGAPWSDRAYIVFGRDGAGAPFPAAVDLSSLDGSDGFRLEGLPDAQTGIRVAQAGDVNSDGFPDALIVEGFRADARCYVLYGRDTSGGPSFPAIVDLTTLDGDDGFRIDGPWMRDAAAAGDINGDGADDLVIGIPIEGGRGKVYVVYGRTDGACYADCDGSGSLDFFDFLCFQNQFAAGDPQADCDQSGELDFFDFLCFQNAFAAGCP